MQITHKIKLYIIFSQVVYHLGIYYVDSLIAKHAGGLTDLS